ncbi:MAG: nicotinate-nucleotide adenylyltransferase [Candidatus Eremiobacteraeota bacterium]|nr:nicotinate-nucleotide adenylyltransferase [Candidatus Eremiobacteraeota bacterium]
MSTLGVMGGTFNPVHYGHLLAAQEAMTEFHLDEILFIPNQIPPHKVGEKDIADAEHRFLMVSLAIASNPAFKVSRVELDRLNVSYTMDTVRKLKKLYLATEVSFITGADALIKYEWYAFEELLSLLTYFIVVTRPGFLESHLDQKIKEKNLKTPGKIKVLSIPGVGISSSDIRRRLAAGKPIRYLIPQPVEEYIYKYKLYIE